VTSPRSKSTRAWWLWTIVVAAIVAGTFTAYRQFAGQRRFAAVAPGQAHQDPERLRQAVISMRQGCSSLSTTFFQGATGQAEYWSVRCASGREYQVAVDANGTADVLDCDVLARLATRPCFTVITSKSTTTVD
jgi:hypothetical protein